jgi:hypothetical protein
MNDFSEFFNDDPWANLDYPCYPEGRRLYLKDDRFWVSMDSEGKLIFFIHERGFKSVKTKNNFSSVTIEILQYGESESRLKCTLTCETDDLREKFAIVAKDVAYSCSQYSGKELFSKILSRVKSWADFLMPNRSGLSNTEFLGFLGELYVLQSIVMTTFNPIDAVNFWIGPEMQKQDFSFNSKAIEVKSAMSGSPNRINISSLDQLDRITNKLYLLRIIFNRATEGSGFNLQEIYNKSILCIDTNLEAKSKFLLKTAYFLGKASEEQLSDQFSVAKIELYEVTDSFPRLTRSQSPNDIVDASYQINTSSISKYLINKDVREILLNE